MAFYAWQIVIIAESRRSSSVKIEGRSMCNGSSVQHGSGDICLDETVGLCPEILPAFTCLLKRKREPLYSTFLDVCYLSAIDRD